MCASEHAHVLSLCCSRFAPRNGTNYPPLSAVVMEAVAVAAEPPAAAVVEALLSSN
jgi:hypothetical protein